MSLVSPVVQVALDDWISSPRLIKALNEAGMAVIGLCSRRSPLRLSRYLTECHVVAEPEMRVRLEDIVARLHPALVIASDEQSVRFLQRLALDPTSSEALRGLLRVSLGEPSKFGVITSKWEVSRLATTLGIKIPEQAKAESAAEAVRFATRTGYPVVLKQENSYGGMACKVCTTPAEIHEAFRRLATGRFGRRSLIRRGIQMLAPGRTSGPVIVQRHVDGTVAFTAAVAREGEMLAALALQVEVMHPKPTGPSTVVRLIDAPQLIEATRLLIEGTGYSGFVGVDFIIGSRTGEPILLELNPRVTPVCHLGTQLGADLCGALGAAFCGCPNRTRAPPVMTAWRSFPRNGCAIPTVPTSRPPSMTFRWTSPACCARRIGNCRSAFGCV